MGKEAYMKERGHLSLLVQLEKDGVLSEFNQSNLYGQRIIH